MSTCHFLEPTLQDILRVVNPLKEDWTIRFQIIEDLQAVIQSIESLRGATVEPFGSFVSNLFSRWGDLDISIELSNGSYIASAGKKHKQTLLGDVQRALRKNGGWRKLHFIAHARVPILKLETINNISCDISISNLSGQMKSKLLFWINEIDGRFRDVVLLVKEWAKANNVNDPKFGTLNSYSLSLLVLFHFQTCVPAILPPLKEIYAGNMVDDLTGVRALAEKRVEEICAVNINRYRSDSSRMINKSSVSQLFISFFEKFSSISSKAPTQGISPYTGQWEDIDTNMRWLPKTYALFIEDPFEQPINTARTVSDKQLVKITDSLQTTYNLLTTRSADQNLVISTLVRPQISRFLARVPGKNQSSYSDVAHPQIQRIIQPPFRVQQQSPPYKKLEKRPNGALPGKDMRPNGAIPGQDRHLNGALPGQDRHLNGALPGQDRRLNGIIPGQDRRLNGLIPGQDRRLNGIIPGQDRRLNGVIPGQDRRLNGVIPGQDRRLNGVIPGQDRRLNGIIPGQDRRLNGVIPGQDRRLNGIITGQDKRLNGSTYRPPQAQHSSRQQVWRRRSEA